MRHLTDDGLTADVEGVDLDEHPEAALDSDCDIDLDTRFGLSNIGAIIASVPAHRRGRPTVTNDVVLFISADEAHDFLEQIEARAEDIRRADSSRDRVTALLLDKLASRLRQQMHRRDFRAQREDGAR